MARIPKDNTEGRSRREPARRPAAPAATRAVDEVSWGPWRANPEPAQNEGAEAGDLPQALGERIAELLAAAETSAEQIRLRARDEAAEILRKAEESAERQLADLSREPERLRAEVTAQALATRAAADEYVSLQRRRAGEELAEQRRRADRQAEALIAAAQDQARALSAAAEREARRLDDENRRAIEAAAADVQYLKRVRDDAAAAMLGLSAALRETAERLEAEVIALVDGEAAFEYGPDRARLRLGAAEVPGELPSGDRANPLGLSAR